MHKYENVPSALREMTQRVCNLIYPTAACWEASLMLRDALLSEGIPAHIAVVTVFGCDEHCVVICEEYVCDPTVFQFETGDDWVVERLTGSPYTLGGDEEFTAAVTKLKNEDGLRMHADSIGLSEDEVSAIRDAVKAEIAAAASAAA
jgi:hypothetical protein